jgi:hypothetical protein
MVARQTFFFSLIRLFSFSLYNHDNNSALLKLILESNSTVLQNKDDIIRKHYAALQHTRQEKTFVTRIDHKYCHGNRTLLHVHSNIDVPNHCERISKISELFPHSVPKIRMKAACMVRSAATPAATTRVACCEDTFGSSGAFKASPEVRYRLGLTR